MATDKIQTGLRLSPALYEAAAKAAQEDKRSLNNLIEYALDRYLKEREDKIKRGHS